MKTKEELLSMSHEDLASLTYKIMYEQCLLENKEKENKRLREILDTIGVTYETFKSEFHEWWITAIRSRVEKGGI